MKQNCILSRILVFVLAFPQLSVKMSDVQSSLKQFSHEQQEAVELIRSSKKELEHSEETERNKIENKIKVSLH